LTTGTDDGVVPEIYLDETTPPPRATPDDWIVRKGDAFMIDNGPGFYDEDEESEALRLNHGERVAFSRLYTYPDATLTFLENGKYRCAAPEGAEHVMVACEPQTMMDSVDQLAAYLREDGDGNPGDEYELKFYTWTDENWFFDAEAGKFTRGAA